jgi:EAL and modified HD-GYP domain-containing signal transduction protein
MKEVSQVFIARQPIFDRALKVVGYEVLFRNDATNEARVSDDSAATATVVLNALTEIGLERIVGSHTAWINLPRQFLLDGLASALPPRFTCFEILEGQLIDEPFVEAVRELKRQGYRIALDDFAQVEGVEELLPLADVIKLDYLALGRERIAEQMGNLRRYNMQLLAEKVETREDHSYCQELGFDLFQGFFYQRPELISSRRIDLNRDSVLQVIAALQNPALQLDDVEPLIARDISLSLRLLRYINSAFFGLAHEVASVRQAMVLLGLDNIRRWATLTIVGSLEGESSELTTTGLIRARFCELAGGTLNHDRSELFTLGLFSLIDAMLDAPLEDILREIPFPTDMREALVEHTGFMGELLNAVASLEAGYIGDAKAVVPNAGELYMEALLWANEASDALFAAA